MIKDFERLCRNRKSIRRLSDKLIEENKLIQILSIVKSAPSAGNLQAYEVVVVKSKEIIRNLFEAALHQRVVGDAPVVLAFIAKPQESSEIYGKRGEQLYSIQDATIACTYAMLACEALGISSTWVGAFEDDKIKEILHCEKDQKPVALLPIGYSMFNRVSSVDRKELSQISREL